MSYTPGQSHALSEPQRAALDDARAALRQTKDSTAAATLQIALLRAAIEQVLDKLDDDGPPVAPADWHAVPAVVAWHPGYCTCGGHVSHDGTFTPPEIVTMPGAIHAAVPVRAL